MLSWWLSCVALLLTYFRSIVAIHGLNGHRERTWTASNGVYWLRDLLPNDIPQSRIMSYGYNVNVFDRGGHGVNQQSVYDHARALISDLVLKRQLTETERRPILFVVHSLGGIVLKAALIHSDLCRPGSLESHHAIATSTHGIIFMGVPHQGGNGVALGKSLINIASSVTKTDTRIMKDLERDSQLLSTQLGQYQAISGQFVTAFAYETLETKTVFGHTLMVRNSWKTFTLPERLHTEANICLVDCADVLGCGSRRFGRRDNCHRCRSPKYDPLHIQK